MTNSAPSTVSSGESWLALFLIVLLILVAVRDFARPAPLSASAHQTEFSLQRALADLRFIAARPHPVGSAQDMRVRDYIVEQLKSIGLEPQTQHVSAVAPIVKYGPPYFAGSAENVMVRLPGTNPTGTVLWMAHYDSAPTAPGAGDDGSGVVVMLEILRALRTGSSPRNTMIFLFSDGEEAGSIGAEAFAREHPWAKSVTFAMNSDTGGNCGPAVAGLASPHSGWVVRELAKAIPHVRSASIVSELARLSPDQGGDDRPFVRKGVPVLLVTYIGCSADYHLMGDNPQNLDARSLQEFGSNALALARHFGSSDLKRSDQKDDMVSFFFMNHFFFYPKSWVTPTTVMILLLVALALFIGLRRRLLTGRGLTVAFVFWLMATVAAGCLADLLWWTLNKLRLVNVSFASAYNAMTYAWGIVALATALVLSPYITLRRKTTADELTGGALLWCTVWMVLTCLFTPGASYFFTWPLLFAALALTLAFTSGNADSRSVRLISWVGAVVSVDLLAGMIGFVIITLLGDLTISMIVLGVLAALLCALLAPQLQVMTARKAWLLPSTCACLGFVLIAVGMAQSGYDTQHPKPDSIFYFLDADTGKASWMSFDEQPDAWTSQFLSGKIETGRMSNLGWIDDPFLKAPAPSLPLAQPALNVLADSTAVGERTLQLHIHSPRRARVLWFAVQGAEVVRATVAGNAGPVRPEDIAGKFWGFVYAALPPEGVDVELTLKGDGSPVLSVMDQADGLPEIYGLSVHPRPPDRIPQFWPTFDSTTVVMRTFSLARPAKR